MNMYLININGYNYGHCQTLELLYLCHMKSLSSIVQSPGLAFGPTWHHTQLITATSSFSRSRDRGNEVKSHPILCQGQALQLRVYLHSPICLHGTKREIYLSLFHVCIFIFIWICIFVTNFILNNPEDFHSCVNSRNKDCLHRPPANLSFRQMCLLHWH